MNHRKFECEEYNIHFIKTNKFHTIDFSIIFTENANKKAIAYRNILIDVMSLSTKKYDTTSKLIKKCQDLYSLKPTIYDVRMGNLLKTKFSISTINSSYAGKQNIFDNILLLKELVLNPYIDEKGFDEKKIEVVKKKVATELGLLKESPRMYTNYMALKQLGNDMNYNLTNYTDEDILKEITNNNLYESYLEMLHHSKIDIMISGNVSNEEKIVQFIKDHFHFNHQDIKLNEPYTHHVMVNKEPIKAKETRHFNQSKLAIVYKLCSLTDYENKYVLNIFNSILGNNGDCLLMREIREKQSLCYYINSFFNKLDNILLINSGIDAVNYEKVLDLVQEVLLKIQRGEFNSEDIKTAKLSILEDYDSIKESNTALAEYQYGREIFQSDELKVKKALTRKVSKKDIMELAKKLDLASVFFIEGDL